MRIFDTHCHIYDEVYQEDFFEVLSRCKENNVELIMLPGDNLKDSMLADKLSKEYDFIYAQVGLHPTEIEGVSIEEGLEKLEYLANNNSKIRAIGEIGLDYHYECNEEIKKRQKKFFDLQITLANKLHLPVVIHSRDAYLDTMEVLKQNPPLYGCLFHCFSYSKECLAEVIKSGYYIGLDGPVTYKNAITPKEIAKVVPLDRLVVETDSPYLSPVPFRGKRNEPSFIVKTILEIAVLRGMTFEDIAEATYVNGCTFFGIEYEK